MKAHVVCPKCRHYRNNPGKTWDFGRLGAKCDMCGSVTRLLEHWLPPIPYSEMIK